MVNSKNSLLHKNILVTGAAGFIGAHLILELFKSVPSIHIVGIDNMNNYYDVNIKKYRLSQIESMIESKKILHGLLLRGQLQIGNR